MTKFFSSLALCATLSLAAWPALAQDLKIGIVNLDRIVRESGPDKAAQTKLEAEFGKRE